MKTAFVICVICCVNVMCDEYFHNLAERYAKSNYEKAASAIMDDFAAKTRLNDCNLTRQVKQNCKNIMTNFSKNNIVRAGKFANKISKDILRISSYINKQSIEKLNINANGMIEKQYFVFNIKNNKFDLCNFSDNIETQIEKLKVSIQTEQQKNDELKDLCSTCKYYEASNIKNVDASSISKAINSLNNQSKNIASLQKKQISLANNNSEMHDKIINEARNAHRLQANCALARCIEEMKCAYHGSGVTLYETLAPQMC